jgi:cell division protein FtsW
LGKKVNGSTRWLNLGVVAIQVSELVKFCIITYLASYIVRQREALKTQFFGFARPLVLLGLISGLLLLEPDFGATVVIVSTALSMLFLAGVPFFYFFGLCCFTGIAFIGLAISAPYRLQRLTAFLDPWAYQFESGYQLTQALIAFGRGEWFGVGLGSSVQKLFYLPEAYTDFVFAVLAEELGLIGGLCVIALYVLLVVRGMKIGLTAEKRGAIFGAFCCYGITFWIGFQAFISMGVNTGLLPTKGLTLPFLSYGGCSLIVLCIAIALIFRVDFENRTKHRQGIDFGK